MSFLTPTTINGLRRRFDAHPFVVKTRAAFTTIKEQIDAHPLAAMTIAALVTIALSPLVALVPTKTDMTLFTHRDLPMELVLTVIGTLPFAALATYYTLQQTTHLDGDSGSWLARPVVIWITFALIVSVLLEPASAYAKYWTDWRLLHTGGTMLLLLTLPWVAKRISR